MPFFANECFAVARNNPKQPLSGLCLAFRCGHFDVAADLISEFASAREAPAEGFDKPIVTLPALHFGRPRAHCRAAVGVLVSQKRTNTASASLEMPTCRSIRSRWRVMRSSRRAKASSAIGAVGRPSARRAPLRRRALASRPLDRRSRRAPQRGPAVGVCIYFVHIRNHIPEIVGAIERRLARGGAEVALHDPLALHLVVGPVLQRLEFLETGLRGPATISSCSGSSGSRRMPAFAGSSTVTVDGVITASSQSP